MIPDPVIEEVGNVFVLRDDIVPGGTKQRVLTPYVSRCTASEIVYASPAFGYAQIALAHACRETGKQATIFTAKRNDLHKRTQAAKDAGARIVMVPHGYLSNVKAKAKSYCEMSGAHLLPFGLDMPEFIAGLAAFARSLPIKPKEVWTVAGSGVLSRSLQVAWPDADFHAIKIGAHPNAGRAKIWEALETFEQDAKEPPPFPSCSNYDAKAWRFIKQHASPGALFVNVAA